MSGHFEKAKKITNALTAEAWGKNIDLPQKTRRAQRKALYNY
jgi:hypothetical protein